MAPLGLEVEVDELHKRVMDLETLLMRVVAAQAQHAASPPGQGSPHAADTLVGLSNPQQQPQAYIAAVPISLWE
jgi:hypothetical protein